MRPRWCLRCLTLLGRSMVATRYLLGAGRSVCGRRGRRSPRPRSRLGSSRSGWTTGDRETLGHDLALVDPHLDADAAEGRLGLAEAVVDVGAQRVQRHAALAVVLAARHLGAAQAAAALDAHAGGARADGAGERPLHGAPEAHAVLELLGDGLGHEHGVELGTLDLDDVHLDVLLGHRVELFAQRVDLGAALADHDARTGGVDVDRHVVLVLADDDPRQAGVRRACAKMCLRMRSSSAR